MDTNKTHTKIDYSQFPSNTPVYGEFSNENNIYTYVYIKEALRIKSNMLNKTMRRSLIAYDIIVDEKEELKDPLTYMEETLDNQLEDMGYPVKYINEYKKDDVEKVEKLFETSYENATDKKQFKVYLPNIIFNNTELTSDNRNYNKILEDGFLNRYAISYSSRMDRVEAKRQLIDYETNNIQPTHAIAQELIETDCKEDKIPVYLDEIRKEGIPALEKYKDEFYYRKDKFRAFEALYEYFDYSDLYRWKYTIQRVFGYTDRVLKSTIDDYCKEYNRLMYNDVLFEECNEDILNEDGSLNKHVLIDIYELLYKQNKYLLIEYIYNNYKAYKLTDLKYKLTFIGYVDDKNKKDFVQFLKQHMNHYDIEYVKINKHNIVFRK